MKIQLSLKKPKLWYYDAVGQRKIYTLWEKEYLTYILFFAKILAYLKCFSSRKMKLLTIKFLKH